MSLISSIARSFCIYHLYVCLYSNGSVVLTHVQSDVSIYWYMMTGRKTMCLLTGLHPSKHKPHKQLVNSLNKARQKPTTAVTYGKGGIQTDIILSSLWTILLSCNIIAVFHCRNSTVSYLIWCCSSSHSTSTQISNIETDGSHLDGDNTSIWFLY